MKLRYRSVLARTALAAALIAGSLGAVAAPATADATIVSDLVDNPSFVSKESKCEADVAIIGARGSAQPLMESNEGKPTQEGSRPQDQIAGFGNEVATAAYEIVHKLSPTTNVRLIPVDYPAVEAVNGVIEAFGGRTFLISPWGIGNNETYMASVEAGATIIVDTVRKLGKACPGTKIVLMGFSQGAHSTHLALDKLKTEGLLKDIAAVQLIADPMRNPNDKTPYNYSGKGTKGSWTLSKLARPIPDSTWDTGVLSTIQKDTDLTNGFGALRYGVPLNPRIYVPVPTELEGKVVNVCHMLDQVCNLSFVMDDHAHGSVYTDTYDYRHPQVTKRIHNSDIYTVPGEWVFGKLGFPQYVGGGSSGIGLGQQCADLTVIGARGEDWLETPEADSAGPEIPGFGPAVSAAARKLKDEVPSGTSVKFASVLPALPPRDPGAPMHGIMGPPNMFDLQVIDGTKKASELAAKTVAECPNTKLVMLGYSQGAQVLHETVASAPQPVIDRIAAVWLMGDTAREPKFFGSIAGAGETLPADDSGGQYVADAEGRGTVALPLTLKDRVRNVCMLADKGCRAPSGSYNGATNRQTQRSIYLTQDTLAAGAEWAAKRVGTLPLPAGAQEAKIRRDVGPAATMAHERWKTYGTGYLIRRLG
ncbi:cutinase family protein [Arthrobacter sp. UYCo732]|uniref:cutinase family protein n=1 Tax=Arthrobacter sp. UYCo732 TaxID=3156336 RepID=UPI003393C4B2